MTLRRNLLSSVTRAPRVCVSYKNLYIEFLISYSRKQMMCITFGNLVVVLRHFYFGKETHAYTYISRTSGKICHMPWGGWRGVGIDIVPDGFFRFGSRFDRVSIRQTILRNPYDRERHAQVNNRRAFRKMTMKESRKQRSSVRAVVVRSIATCTRIIYIHSR